MENKSGIHPIGYQVLVKTVALNEEKSAGGIIFTPNTREANQLDAAKAIVIEIGEHAWIDIGTGKPLVKVGETIGHAKYSGKVYIGKDRDSYILLSDKDILCKIDK